MVDTRQSVNSGVPQQQPSDNHIPDKVLMYACIFTYENAKIRTEILNYKVNLQQFESK
jgi:hypothetical protein